MSKNKDTANFFKTPLFYMVLLTFLTSISTPLLTTYYDYLDDSQINRESIQDLVSVGSFSILTLLGIMKERFKINQEIIDLANMAVNKDDLINKVKSEKRILTTPPHFPGRTNFEK